LEPSERAKRLVDGLAPYWAGEAEVFRTYWTSSKRTRESDRRWLALQCWKEIWGSGVSRTREGLFLGAARDLVDAFPRIDVELARRDVLALVENLRAEFAHYCAFADAHDALALPGEPRLAPRDLVGWDEDERLAELRFAHKREHSRLGARAARITEGGFGTLYASGAGLAATEAGPHARANELIAAACQSVHADELAHMGAGLRGIDDEAFSEAEWDTLERMAIAQSQLRIAMRNAQFGRPLAGDRLSAAMSGRISSRLGEAAVRYALTRHGAKE
jgi:hypothetical protein